MNCLVLAYNVSSSDIISSVLAIVTMISSGVNRVDITFTARRQHVNIVTTMVMWLFDQLTH